MMVLTTITNGDTHRTSTSTVFPITWKLHTHMDRATVSLESQAMDMVQGLEALTLEDTQLQD